MRLFHSTRSAEPSEIYADECGFDLRFCACGSARGRLAWVCAGTSGMWGPGIYFAVNAVCVARRQFTRQHQLRSFGCAVIHAQLPAHEQRWVRALRLAALWWRQR